MSERSRLFGGALALILSVSAHFGCAQAPGIVTALWGPALEIDAWGPGTVFPSVEEAAVDALKYVYLQDRDTGHAGLVRGGAISLVDGGYTYGEIAVAGPWSPHQIRYTLEPWDVARFVIYPQTGNYDVDRANERPTVVDRRFVRFIDPLHRPIFILHPSLVIREYHGDAHDLLEVADLRHPPQTKVIARGP